MTRSRKRKMLRLSATRSTRGAALGLPFAPLLLVGAQVAHAQQDPEQGAMLEEVVVTAQKQSENLQSVPMSIQAFGTEKLQELRINSLEDAVKFLPAVTVQSAGPGFTQVFMRGIANGSNGNHSGPMPSVGQYLDEQPITTIQGSIPIHIYDIERVEVLEGPQGTLYGASSQAGTIRTITNKPDTKAFSASYDLQGNFVQSGETGYTAEGYVNIPVTDSMAVRLVGWYEHVPGYIDNVYGEMHYPTWDSPPNTEDEEGNDVFLPPTGSMTENNSKYVKQNYNDVDTYGARALLKIDLNDSWSITPGIMGQQTKTNGVFFYDPNIGDLEVTHFNPEDSKDHWYQASLTVEGRIGNFDLVYAGAYLDRNDSVNSDYSDYSYWYDVLYGSGYYLRNDDGQLINPSQFIRGKDDYKMWSNEIRLSSPRDQRFRFVVGAFAQQGEHRIEQRYMVNDLAEYLSVPLWEDTIWLTQQTRKSSSYAGFGEMYYDITDKLTGTLGIRVFSASDSLKGFFGFNENYYDKYGTAFCFQPVGVKTYHGAPCINLNKDTSDSGNTPKANLTYRFDADRMAYLTYSKGYRPGGVNRNGTYPPYDPDYLTNYEAGWKTTWLSGSLRFNGAIFFQNWDKVQFSRLPPNGNGLTVIQNAGKASANGAEASVDWAAGDGLLLSAGVMWVDAKLTQSFCAAQEDDGSCSDGALTPKDAGLPSTPSFKGNLLARYTFNLGDNEANVQASYMYQTDVIQEMIKYDRQFVGNAGAYQLVDLSAGIKDGPYSVTLFVNNLFNNRAEYYKTAECYVGTCGQVPGHPYTIYDGVAQPRTIGMIFRQEF